MINLCIVLPTYNNYLTIETMVNKLSAHNYPIIIVNDGSDERTAGAIKQTAASHSDVFVITRKINGGKGAAVMDGVKFAAKKGFSHVLQIDADNQHNVDDLPVFADAAQNNPYKMILGVPVFPENTPKGRLTGRRISIVWVIIETVGRAIKDPLFGYRVYPVSTFLKVIENRKMSTRMDFDLEIVVRMYWAGADVVNIPTKVIYYEDGLSSFRMFYDNVAISLAHTKLFLGMLVRFPKLMLRRFRK